MFQREEPTVAFYLMFVLQKGNQILEIYFLYWFLYLSIYGEQIQKFLSDNKDKC